MTRRRLIFILATTTALSALAFAAARARDVPKVATGFVANILCSSTFVSGLDPDRVLAETTAAMPGTGLITWALRATVDRARKDVTVTLLGLGRSHAVYREGFGCYLDHGDAVADISLPADTRQAERYCPRSRDPRWSRRSTRSSTLRSVARLPNPRRRRSATPRRLWC